NSSQVEVVGDAGLLASVTDPSDLAEKLARVLDEPALSRELGEKSRERSLGFSWGRSAGLTLDALKSVARPGPQARWAARLRSSRPRVAFFSPFPPKPSGVGNYSESL